MSTVDLSKKSVSDLQAELHELSREQFNLRMQKATGQLNKPHLLQQVRRNIARVKTLINELKGKA